MPLQQITGSGEPPIGLVVTEHCFAKQVEIETDARPAQRPQAVVELPGARIQDEVAHHAAQRPPGNRHDRPRDQRCESPAELNGDPHVPGQERGNRAGEPLEVAASDPQVFRTHHAVDESDREVETARVFEHASQSLFRTARCDIRTLGEPAMHGGDGLGGERIGARGRIGSGRKHVSRLLALATGGYFGRAERSSTSGRNDS